MKGGPMYIYIYDTIQLDCFCVETFAFWLITNYMKHSIQFTIKFKTFNYSIKQGVEKLLKCKNNM